MKQIRTITMSPQEWYEVADNPRQRDTVRRAERATHLRVLHPSHAVVHMAELPRQKGEAKGTVHRYKVDGHTRAYVWQNNLSDEVPEEVIVHVYEVDDLDEVKRLYEDFDSPLAGKNTVDYVFGAYRETEFMPKGEVLKAARITQGLKMVEAILEGSSTATRLSRGGRTVTPVFSLIQKYLPQLKALDPIASTRGLWSTAMITAFVLTHLQHGSDCLEFWDKFEKDEGTRTGGAMDGVQALREEVNRRRITKTLPHRFHEILELTGKALSCYEGYQNNSTFTRTPIGIDAIRYAKRNKPGLRKVESVEQRASA